MKTTGWKRLAPLMLLTALVLVPQSALAIDYDLVLETGQSVPLPTLGGATPTGSATVSVNTLTGDVSVTGSYSGMTSNVTAAHIHGLAPVGAATDVLITLTPTGGTSGTISGSGTLSAANLLGLIQGQTYINVHTMNNGPGELRDQVQDPDVAYQMISLETAQAVPAPNVTGFTPSGSATVVGDASTGEIEVSGSYAGMTTAVTATHLHGLAASGATADVLFGLTISGGTSGTISGSGTLAGGDLLGFQTSMTYVNVHTSQNAAGEIRGQVDSLVPVELQSFSVE